MAVTNYYTVDGQILGEATGGVRTDYLTDALGSITATVDQGAAVLNTYRHKPYGGLLAKTGTEPDPKFLWTGDTGSRKTGLAFSDQYNQARHYGTSQGQWITVDSLWPHELQYGYARNNPVTFVDPTGESIILPLLCIGACVGAGACGGSIWWACKDWYPGYDSFEDCAVEFILDLPIQSIVGCGVYLAGCLACLLHYAPKLCKKLDGICSDEEWAAMGKGIHAVCDLPSSCSPENKGFPPPPLTKAKICAFAIPRIVAGTACLAARVRRQILCWRSDKNPTGHWQAVGDVATRLLDCLKLAKDWKCYKK